MMTPAEKIVKDRLNELKSKLKDETSAKLTKRLNEMRVYSLNISIHEVEWILEKIRREGV